MAVPITGTHTVLICHKRHPSDGFTFLGIFQLKKKGEADKMAQWIKTSATKLMTGVQSPEPPWWEEN